MSLTPDMKDELARVVVTTLSEAAAEASATPHSAGGLYLVDRRILAEAELDSPVTARRPYTYLQTLCNTEPPVVVASGSSLRHGKHYVVRVVHRTDEFVCPTGPVDFLRRPVCDLPPILVTSRAAEAAAIWHSAFLAYGLLMEPERSSSFEIMCLGPETVLAMIGCAHKPGAFVHSKKVRGTDHISVRDSDAIGTLISAMGAPQTFEAWQGWHEHREARGSTNRLANFDDTNLRRSARMIVAAGARAEYALEILGGDVPAYLLETGTSRLQYKQASPKELDKRTNPPLIKDAVTDCVHRLLTPADKVAHECGIPDTESALTLDIFERD